MSVEKTISDRKATHGDFYSQASVSMRIITTLENSKNWRWMDPDQKESLLLIAVKIGRILTGNYNEPDHWHDIGGYAKLVENRLHGLPSNGNVPTQDQAGLVAAFKEKTEQLAVQGARPNYPWSEPPKAAYTGESRGDSSRGTGGSQTPAF